MKIALDVLGGDHSPIANIEGALAYLEEFGKASAHIILVGDQPQIETFLQPFDYRKANIIKMIFSLLI